MASHLFAACILIAAQAYTVPPAILLGILEVEGGRVGLEAGPNSNGTYDLGLMQINTLWMKELASYWNVSQNTARTWVRDDGCTNINVAAWILRQKINQTGSLNTAIAYYHSATPHRGAQYRRKVINAMRRMNLLPYESQTRTSAVAGKKPG